MIISHETPEYIAARDRLTSGSRTNGAYFYSVEIVKNIIPHVKTDRPWVTIRAGDRCADRAIVFIHNNAHPERYAWLAPYNDLVLVCGVESTCEKVEKWGTPIYLPLSIDVEYVQNFTCEKTRGTAYVGRKSKMEGTNLPGGIDYLYDMERDDLLATMAAYKNVYAVGRCAVEARALGCNVLPYDPRYPDPEIWQVLDNRDAADMLQQKLDEVDS